MFRQLFIRHQTGKCFLTAMAMPLAGLILTSAAQGTSVTVVNAGFEDISGESQTNEFTFGALNGWDLYDPDSVTSNGNGPTYFIGTLTPFEPDPVGNPGVYSYFPAGAAQGQRVGIAFNFNGSDGQGEYGFHQELSATLQAHTTYTLQVEIGNIDSGTGMNGTFFPLQGFPGYRVELLAGDVLLEEDDNTLASSISDGAFGTSTVSFSTGAAHDQLGENLGIRLINLNQEDPSFPGSDLEVDFDDVRLDAAATLAGDFDLSGTVDGTDFLVWQRSAALMPPSATDLSDWQTNYGSFSATVAVGHVPEPETAFMLLVSLFILQSLRSAKQ